MILLILICAPIIAFIATGDACPSCGSFCWDWIHKHKCIRKDNHEDGPVR